jgi:hypothetical protein
VAKVEKKGRKTEIKCVNKMTGWCIYTEPALYFWRSRHIRSWFSWNHAIRAVLSYGFNPRLSRYWQGLFHSGVDRFTGPCALTRAKSTQTGETTSVQNETDPTGLGYSRSYCVIQAQPSFLFARCLVYPHLP